MKLHRSVKIVFLGFIVGILFWGGFHTALEKTNTLDFCISCHEMQSNLFQEYKKTIHYKNRTGVTATCPDCHVPKDWYPKLKRKILASQELFYKLTGTIDTKEKFEKKRLKLAQQVWTFLENSDSRECRSCHKAKSMALSLQQRRSKYVHQIGNERGRTCIDCHKGIAHHLPEGFKVEKGGSDKDHLYYAKKELACYLCHPDMPEPEDWGF